MARPSFVRKEHTGPLQIVHDFRFTALNVRDDYSFLDAMSHEQKLLHMKKRIDSLADKGYGGVVLNVDHIGYLERKDSFERVREIALYAKSRGMRVWLYDEQYYPSGAAGGKTLEGHSELEAAALSCVERTVEIKNGDGAIRVPSPLGHSALKFATAVPVEDGAERFDRRIDVSDCRDIAGGLCFHAATGVWKVYCFFVRVLYEATKLCQGTRASRRYINIRDKNAVGRFYDLTFTEGYNQLFPSLSDAVDAVFTDEPNTPLFISWKGREKRTGFESFSVYDMPNNDIPVYPFVPWHDEVPDILKEEYGVDFRQIVVDVFTQTPDTRKARTLFYSVLSDMAVKAFPEQLQAKLSSVGVRLSGHYYGEEGLDAQPFYYGDILEHLAAMGIPGCDNLKSEARALRHCTACKLASSAAHISGRDKVMIEASNMTDANQEITLAELKGAIGMMFALGINVVTSYYGENILEYGQMKEFAGYIANLSSLFGGGRFYADTLLYYPFEELCAACEPEGIVEVGDGFHDWFGIMETSKRLLRRQVSFDFINKKRLLACRIGEGFLEMPFGNSICRIVMPGISYVDKEVAEYLLSAWKKGVEVVFDGEERSIENLAFVPWFGASDVHSRDLRLKTENEMITHMHKCFGEYDVYMLMNTDDAPCSVVVEIECSEHNSFCVIDPDTLKTEDVFWRMEEGRAEICVEIDALSPVMICKY